MSSNSDMKGSRVLEESVSNSEGNTEIILYLLVNSWWCVLKGKGGSLVIPRLEDILSLNTKCVPTNKSIYQLTT